MTRRVSSAVALALFLLCASLDGAASRRVADLADLERSLDHVGRGTGEKGRDGQAYRGRSPQRSRHGAARASRRPGVFATAGLFAALGFQHVGVQAGAPLGVFFSELDDNRDGLIDRYEFEKGAMRRFEGYGLEAHESRHVAKERFLTAFERADENGDGFLTEAETGRMLDMMKSSMRAEAQNALGQLSAACDFSQESYHDAEMTAGLITTIIANFPDEGASVENMVYTLTKVVAVREDTNEVMTLTGKIYNFMSTLVLLSDVNQDGWLSKEETKYMLHLSVLSLENPLGMDPNSYNYEHYAGEPSLDIDDGIGAWPHGTTYEWESFYPQPTGVGDKIGEREWQEAGHFVPTHDGEDDPEVAAMISEMDEDLDGRISKDEFFSAATSVDTSEKTANLAERLFTTFDTDGDGHLDSEEVGRLVQMHDAM